MPSRFCTECGTELSAEQRFCPECGTPVQLPTSASAPARTVSRTQPNRPPMALLWGLGAVAITVVLVVIYWVIAQPPAIVGNIPDIHDENGYPFPDTPRIPLQEAKARYDANNVIFVDVRSPGAYNAQHIPGAVLIPISEFEERYRELPQNAQIITYCT